MRTETLHGIVGQRADHHGRRLLLLLLGLGLLALGGLGDRRSRLALHFLRVCRGGALVP